MNSGNPHSRRNKLMAANAGQAPKKRNLSKIKSKIAAGHYKINNMDLAKALVFGRI